jgi:hypothetical protein
VQLENIALVDKEFPVNHVKMDNTVELVLLSALHVQ